jgi:hypothetical protein
MTQEAGTAEDLIVRNLIEALNRLRDDLDRVKLWTAALGSFQRGLPDTRLPAAGVQVTRRSLIASQPRVRCGINFCGFVRVSRAGHAL